MTEIPEGLQELINSHTDMYEVEDELTNYGLEWYETFTFMFQNQKYSFYLIDSGKGDEPDSNYPIVYELKKYDQKS